MVKAVIILISCLVVTAAHAHSTIVLDWEFYHPIKEVWLPYGASGSIQEKLIASGEVPDPFYGKNIEMLQWVENHTWKLRTEFTVNTLQQEEFIELSLPMVDTYGEVYLNGDKILTTRNMFHPYSVQLKEMLVSGHNHIEIVFTPPVLKHKEAYANEKYHLPSPNDDHQISIASRVRKPQYQFGWDWAPRVNTIGLIRPATIEKYDHMRIYNKSTVVTELNDSFALLQSTIYFRGNSEGVLKWESSAFGSKEISFSNHIATRIDTVFHPKLWWPVGLGNAHLYNDKWTLKSIDNQIINFVELNFGIKGVRLVREKDSIGTSYYFEINGERVFAKGANYIPESLFLSEVTDAQIRRSVENMRKSNFNMVRVWGGGTYPDDIFYHLCDSLGIMVWQDFMFACAMYPGDNDFLVNVEEELRYQIPRIASHPSVVQLNGNNEVDVAWKNWGFQDSYRLDSSACQVIEESYDTLFFGLIPLLVNELSELPYTHTSPLSNWGKPEDFRHGSQHYWGVWHGNDSIAAFSTKIGRFNAEYGFQSFPEYSTLMLFSDSIDWQLDSEVMKYHQKSYVGNEKIKYHADLLFGPSEDFKTFVYRSQLTQAEAMRVAITSHRLHRNRCGGTLYWQFNDVWPAPTWSGIDVMGNWKAAQYTIRDCMEDLALLYEKDNKGKVHFYLVSDQPDSSFVKLKCLAYDPADNQYSTLEFGIQIEEPGVYPLLKIDSLLKDEGKFVTIEFSENDGPQAVKTFNFTRETASDASVKISSISIDTLHKTGMVKVITSHAVSNCWVHTLQGSIYFEDNFKNLLPGEHSFHFTFDSTPRRDDFKIIWN